MAHSTRIPKLHRLPTPSARRDALSEYCDLPRDAWKLVTDMSMAEWTAQLDTLIENVVGVFPMPLGIATGFVVNGVERVVPMVTEERTIIAGASKAAKMAGGEFLVNVSPPITRGHAYFSRLLMSPEVAVRQAKGPLAEIVADIMRRQKNEARRSGNLLGAWAEGLEHHRSGSILKINLSADVGETMGANAITRLAEEIAQRLGEALDLEPLMGICCNDVPERAITAEAVWRPGPGLSYEQIGRLLDAQDMAEADPERAVTHNKGVMNGIIAVCRATCQDDRAVEIGGAADAYRSGACQPLTSYARRRDGTLSGRLEVQLGLAARGGATAHPMAAFCRALMRAEKAADVIAVAAAVGLAQNFAALYSLTNEGIVAAHEKIGRKKT